MMSTLYVSIPLNKYVDTYIRGEKYIKNKRQGVFT